MHIKSNNVNKSSNLNSILQVLFNVYGVIEFNKNSNYKNVTVQLWDKDILSDDFLGESIIDDEGKFTILASLTEAGEANPELYLKVLISGVLKFTSQAKKVKGLNKHDKATGFVEQSSYNLGTFTML